MKLFQPIFLLLLSIVASALAQEGEYQAEQQQQPPPPQPQDCEAICNERVIQAVQPIDAEKKRTEEWGWGLNRQLEEVNGRLAATEAEVQQLRNSVAEQERQANEARVNLENTNRELEAARREIAEVKHSSGAEIDQLRTKAEEATRSLGSVQFALDEANDQIKELESIRFAVNYKGIGEDAKVYWKNIVSWWTGLVMPDKKNKDEDL